jgi:hypothetical protein
MIIPILKSRIEDLDFTVGNRIPYDNFDIFMIITALTSQGAIIKPIPASCRLRDNMLVRKRLTRNILWAETIFAKTLSSRANKLLPSTILIWTRHRKMARGLNP